MSSPCTLSGGAFQDSEGNVLALGYLKFRLSQDASVNTNSICSGIEITIRLDSSGNVVGGSSIWGNDVLSPVNTYYRVTGYTAAGQPAWGPNNQQVVGSSLDLGTWIPNQVFSWTPPPNGVTFENNGTDNSSQTVLNIESTDASVVITDEGGGSINLQVPPSGASAAFMFGPGFSSIPFTTFSGMTPSPDTAGQVTVVPFTWGYNLTFNKVSFAAVYSGGSEIVNFAIYTAAGAKVWESGPLTITASGAYLFTVPTCNLPPGKYYYAQAGSGTFVQIYGWSVNAALNTPGNNQNILANGFILLGQAANSAPSNVATMPATLGAITGNTSGFGNNFGWAAVTFHS